MLPSGRKTRVLVVDDEDDIRACYGYYLRTAGLDVTLAANGQEAIVAAVRSQPDVIVLDLVMPMLDGYYVIHDLQTRSDTAQIPVVLLTGLPIDEVRRAPQVRALVQKPCTPQVLLNAVKMLGGRTTEAREN
jgi:CheY-like chemotaxis protein